VITPSSRRSDRAAAAWRSRTLAVSGQAGRYRHGREGDPTPSRDRRQPLHRTRALGCVGIFGVARRSRAQEASLRHTAISKELAPISDQEAPWSGHLAAGVTCPAADGRRANERENLALDRGASPLLSTLWIQIVDRDREAAIFEHPSRVVGACSNHTGSDINR